jgi:DivIVA domain-containing protein
MQDFNRDTIIAHRFTSSRRKGYDTLEVDGYLERVAEYVGWMQGELARHQATERSALDVLLQAQRVADETISTAERDAERIRQNAKDGLENARQDARRMLEEARTEADRTLLSAQVEAETALESSREQIAELDAAAAHRVDEHNRLVERFKISVNESASEVRLAGSRLLEMADQFQFEIAAKTEPIGISENEAADLQDRHVKVS